MIAWLAARCDPPDYGKLIVYEFPKDKLVYGPFQLEARINQNTEISQQISLWNQLGSRVIRGNLLVIPIENSLLYVRTSITRAPRPRARRPMVSVNASTRPRSTNFTASPSAKRCIIQSMSCRPTWTCGSENTMNKGRIRDAGASANRRCRHSLMPCQ